MRSQNAPFALAPHSRLRDPEPQLLAWGCQSWSEDAELGRRPTFFGLCRLGSFQRGGVRCSSKGGEGSPLKGQRKTWLRAVTQEQGPPLCRKRCPEGPEQGLQTGGQACPSFSTNHSGPNDLEADACVSPMPPQLLPPSKGSSHLLPATGSRCARDESGFTRSPCHIRAMKPWANDLSVPQFVLRLQSVKWAQQWYLRILQLFSGLSEDT